MRVPIPDDWNGEDWRCVQVFWPDSVGWIGVLLGLLSTTRKGRYWDERTGTITDAQAVADEIISRLIPLDGCWENLASTCPASACSSGGNNTAESDWLDLMACLDISDLLKIEDGILYAMSGCCEWVAIGEIGNLATVPYGTEYFDTLETPPTFSACGKATAVLNAIYSVANSVWDEIDNLNPFQVVSNVKADNPGLSLAASNVTVAWFAAKAMVALADELTVQSNLFDETTWESLHCKAAGIFSADDASAPDDLFKKLTTIFVSEFGQSLTTYADWYNTIMVAIGANELISLAQLGATDTTSTCNCPQEGFLGYTGVVTFNDTRTINTESQGAYLAGATRKYPNVMQFEVQGGQNENYQEVHWDEILTASGTIREIEIEFPLDSSQIAGYYPADTWSDTNPTPQANYMKPPVQGSPDVVTYYPSPNRQRVVCQWNSPVDVSGWGIDFGIKLNPKDQDPDTQKYRFKAIITYAGPIR